MHVCKKEKVEFDLILESNNLVHRFSWMVGCNNCILEEKKKKKKEKMLLR